jgi:MYXO-CTERM domain-containing protein
MTQHLVRSLLLCTLALGAGSALASPSYPTDLQDHLKIANAPSCTLCHTTPSGGVGTAHQPFGDSIYGAGCRLEDVPTLLAALDTLKTNKTDSDGDGVTDIDELIAGTDPNVADAGAPPVDPVLYGFGCTQAAVTSWLPLVGLLGVLAWRRRRA